MILAGIDIGTNTFRLLIADIDPDSCREIVSDRKIIRLGEDLDRTDVLSRDAVERALRTLDDFSENIRRHAVRHVAAVGTSALRKASNSGEFIREARTRSGLDIRVITGEEEARLTLQGVARALRGAREGGQCDPLASAIVIDIGGGSAEIIVTRPHAGPVVTSLPLGAVYLTERFIKRDPPSEDEIDRLRHLIGTELTKLGPMLGDNDARVLAGTAGTITTLAAMEQRLTRYDPDRINRSTLSRASVDAMVRTLSASTLEERRSIPGLERGREDIILAGAVVTQEIMERLGFETILVSDWGLREGIVFDLYDTLSKEHRT